VDPAASDAELDRQTESARRILSDRVGGDLALLAAARAEGITEREVTILLRRQARASLYLDRMVAPMLAPTRTELRQVYAVERHPFTQSSFEEVEPLLRRWWIGRRLADAVEQYYSNARQRIVVTLLVAASDNSGALGISK
jgi:GNAT superfamily N-acetyltransferase